MTRPRPSLTSGSKICASSASPTSVSGTSSPRSLIARISALLSSRDDLQHNLAAVDNCNHSVLGDVLLMPVT